MRIAAGGFLLRSAGHALGDLDGACDPLAERGAVAGAEVAEGTQRRIAVRRRGQDGVGRLRERDHADAVVVRELLEEATDRLLRDREPSRRDVGRDHRARRVHREHDRRLLLLDREGRVRPGEAGRERGERQQAEHRRQVAQLAGAPADQVRRQRRVREGRRLALAPPLEHDVAGDRERHRQERQEPERPVEAHRRPPLRRRYCASGRSQSPSVETTTWPTPSDESSAATSARSAAAAASKR